MKHQIEKYRHFGRCVHLECGGTELYVTLDFGPRIIRFNRMGFDNVFYEQPHGSKDLCTSEGWRLYGGHRFWVAPESEKTYWPDNEPVDCTVLKDTVQFTAARDEYLGVEKRLILELHDDNTIVVEHLARNVSDKTLRCAAWGVSAMDKNAVLSVPWIGQPGGSAPTRFLSVWGDTSLADKRMCLQDDEIVFSHMPTEDYFKIGLWCGSVRARCKSKGQIFSKMVSAADGCAYPDNHVNVEVFMCRFMLEFETLGPLMDLAQGDTCSHTEIWKLDREPQ